VSSRGPLDEGKGRKRYTSPEYRDLVAGPIDPLVHPDPLQPPRLYRLARRVVRWLVQVLFRVTVTGVENIPTPPFIIAANHQAWFDPAFIIPFFPEAPMIFTMAKRETVFNSGWKRRLLPLIGVFPISPQRGELDEAGLRTVYQILERRGVVLIFPEGRYSRGRALRPLRVGIGHFALQAGVPICPVTVRGTDALRPFSRIDVTIGQPIQPDPPAWWALSSRVATIVENVRLALTKGLRRRR
jgi:1-acyl-sn-glycerol-3-phosphate acyltransferase